jgi:hypothetical protein
VWALIAPLARAGRPVQRSLSRYSGVSVNAFDVLCYAKTSFIAAGLTFRAHYAALQYSLIKPPRTCLRSIRAPISTARPGWPRRFLSQALMRPVLVVMAGELGQDLTEMSLAEDQDVVQALSSERAYEPLGK